MCAKLLCFHSEVRKLYIVSGIDEAEQGQTSEPFLYFSAWLLFLVFTPPPPPPIFEGEVISHLILLGLYELFPSGGTLQPGNDEDGSFRQRYDLNFCHFLLGCCWGGRE